MNVWVVDDDESIRWVLEKSLKRDGMSVTTFPGAAELLDALEDLQSSEQALPDVLISDIRMPGMNGLALLERLRSKVPELPVIIMTAHSDLEAAVASYKGGAFEYLPKPFDVDAVATLVRRAVKPVTTESPPKLKTTAAIIGEAPAMQEVFRSIGRLAQSPINVLITGESGTGKELVARALHDTSPRTNRAFVALNTAAIPKDLMESEFFGHEKGAFTGAATQRKGRFEQADGGTLFLDEIGDMPFDLQTRLLRVLQDGEFFRVGGTSPVRVDVRIVAATHQNLEQLVKDGKFREDLYHRLNVIRIRIPTLKERKEDIPALLRHFLLRASKELKSEEKRPLPELLAALSEYDWPGNVRQLENLCRWFTVMAPGQDLHLEDLPPEVLADITPVAASVIAPAVLASVPVNAEPVSLPAAAVVESKPASSHWSENLRLWAEKALQGQQDDLLNEALPLFEKVLIQAALSATDGQRIDAARRLGWGRNTLTRKIKELGLED
jgi:two-component system nitrogen regulation response regulator GlnG